MRKLKRKKQKQEIEIMDLLNKIKYYATMRQVGQNLSLHKCKEEDRNNINPIQPSKVLNVLRSGKIYLNNDPESLALEDFFKKNNINYKLIELCPFCLIKNQYTELINESYKFHNHKICKSCAIDEIKLEVDISEEFIEKLLNKFKDVNKVIDIFNIKNPINHPELTKYDTITCGKEDKIKNYKIDELNIPNELKTIIKKKKIRELLPVQTLAVNGGLLDGKDLVITSATSSGKTLIGELAGIKNLKENKGKFLFLVPLVALANQKYLEFYEKYKNIFSVSLRVGMGRLSEHKQDEISTDPNADIIIGTYEGIDYLLRSGKLNNIGTVVIDEVHSLNMEERGARIDGLIGRLRYLKNIDNKNNNKNINKNINNSKNNIQLIYLSATIGNSKELANFLNANLITYEGRPVPLERHLIFAKNDYNKINFINEVVKKEFNKKSKQGFKGQSLIFTYSRKRAEYLANLLNTRGIKSDYYHAGMEYKRRREVERKFMSQKIMCVITTAALAAGVDFPASTVILESLAMGGDWLNPSEFQQMCGRAGRKGMHNLGKVYMMVELGKKYHAKMGNTEDEIAFKLLGSEPEDIVMEYDEEEELEQILASISFIDKYHKPAEYTKLKNMKLMGKNHDLRYIVETLNNYNMVELHNRHNKTISTTKYGYSTAISFLYPKDAEKIRKNLNKPIMDLVGYINPFENLYIPPHIKNKISKSINTNIPSKFIDSYEIIKENVSKITDKELRDAVLIWIIEFDGMIEEDIIQYFSKYILNLRTNRRTPTQISKILYDNYNIQTYSGDIYSYLENTIKVLDAVERIGSIYNKKISSDAKIFKENISNPYKKKKN